MRPNQREFDERPTALGSRDLGRFSRTGAGAPSQCEVMETACKSEEKWRDLAPQLLDE